MVWKIEEVTRVVKGRTLLEGSHTIVKNLITDSRDVNPGCLFISINGINHKGIDFLDEVIAKGALAIMINIIDVITLDIRKVKEGNITCIVVEDTIYALGEMALYHRKQINAKVVAVTGSVGKTTTRLMISNILNKKYLTKSTTGNMNNQIGLPLTLLKARSHHQVIVLELGMSAIGEIARLGEICQPEIGIITNVAESHLATLGTIHNIARAKSELIKYIKPKGTIVLNFDDKFVRKMSQMTRLNTVSFGTVEEADIKGDKICLTNNGSKFLLITPEGKTEIFIPIPSKGLVMNALAASAVANVLGCSNDEIKAVIESFIPTYGRMNIIKTKIEGLKIIDETYNSSPASLKNALETVRLIKKNQVTLAVLGDMSELGKKSELMHIEAGKLIAKSGIDQLYVTGFFADKIIKGALLAKMPANKIFAGNKHDIAERIKCNLKENTLVLIKGSRNMKMEIILAEIMKSLPR